jgi:hypothetical protein
LINRCCRKCSQKSSEALCEERTGIRDEKLLPDI